MLKHAQQRSQLRKTKISNVEERENTDNDFRFIGNQLSKIMNSIKGKDNISTHHGFTCYVLNQVLETPLRSVILETLENKADFKTPFEYGGENEEIDLHRQLFPDSFSCKETFGFEDLHIETSKLGIVKRHLPGESSPQINLVIHLVGEKNKNIKGATPEEFNKTLEVPIIGHLDFGKGAIIDIRDPQESFNSILERSS